MNFVGASADLLNTVYFNNSVVTWIYAAAVFVALLPALVFLRRFLSNWMKRFRGQVHGDIEIFFSGLISKTKLSFLAMTAFTVGVSLLELPDHIHHIIRCIFIVVLWLQIALWGVQVIRFFLDRMVKNNEKDGRPDPSILMTVNVLEFICRLVLFALVILIILDNLGFNITTLIAGLGVGGIAVALAVQNVLGDLFASLSIVLDKPFVLGDRIIVGTDDGYVEKIGLKTTRLQSISGEQIICSNAELLKSRIRNFKRMRERRIVFHLKVALNTSHQLLEKIAPMLKMIVEAQKLARFDRAHLKEIGDFYFKFEVTYMVLSPDYKIYSEIEHAINLQIVAKLNEASIQIAHNP